MMPRVLMASKEDTDTATAPAGGPPEPLPQSSSASPPPSPSPPPPTPSSPQRPPPPPPVTPFPPPPASPGRNHSPASPSQDSPPPVASPSVSPPPPASTSPPSPPPASKSPPPPSPPSPPPPSRQSPPEEGTSPPPSPSSGTTTPSPPPNAQSSSSSSTPPAGTGTSPPAPRETPSPGTPPSPPTTLITTQAPPIPPPPTGVNSMIMPSSLTPASTSQSTPAATTAGAPPLAPSVGAWGGNVPSGLLIGVALAGFLLALASMFLFLCIKNRWKRRRRSAQMMNLARRRTLVVPERVVSPDVYQPSNGPAASPSGTSSYEFSGTTSWFTYDELAAVTGGFAEEKVIGEGGFGKVYMGALGDGRRVAVKQLKVGSGQGEKEFRAEVDTISRVHHRHLVTLVGYSVTEHHRLLVYEFVSNKTLDHHLHGGGRLPVMDWPKRMKIAIGSARGLTYLHEDCHPRIIHRDIKSANILLDDAFEAKVADFGLAKFTNDSLTHISTRVMGTFGYMAPEYASSGKLTDRSDVFSFGVVLLELITGRKPVDSSQPLGEESLVEWARPLLVDALETDDFRELADPALERRYSKSEMRRMVEAAAACIRHSVTKRPRMVQVWRSLDVEGSSPDLTNGVKLGQSTAYDSNQYSADIELFRRMAFANDLSTAELGYSGEDDAVRHASSSSRPRPS